MKEKNGNILFLIKHQGSFIPEDVLKSLFEERVTKKKDPSSGYGMLIVRDVVNAHNGTINCVNKKGFVEFLITIPKSNYVKKETIFNHCKSVFIFDDEPDYVTFVKNLVPKGIKITSTSVYQEAFDLISKKHFDLLILDLKVGDDYKAGYKLSKLAKKKSKKSITIIHTSTSERLDEDQLPKFGVDFFVQKLIQKEFLLRFFKEEKRVSLIDDDREFLKSLKQFDFDIFESPDDFLDFVDDNKLKLNDFDVVICDYFIGTTDVSRMGFGPLLREKGFKGQLLLCTFSDVELPEGFDEKINKSLESLIKVKK